MQNKTRFIILNENTNFNKSFNLNHWAIYLIVGLFVIILSLSIWGTYRIFFPHKNQQFINENISLKFDTINLLNHLINENIVASSYTGQNCFDYKNHIIGDNYAIQGNILLGQFMQSIWFQKVYPKNSRGIFVVLKVSKKVLIIKPVFFLSSPKSPCNQCPV